MSDYSYSEIQNMQQKAMARVRQMQQRNDEIRDIAQRDLNKTQKSKNNSNPQHSTQKMETKVTNMPPNFPQNSQYPSFKDFFGSEQKPTSPPPKKANKPIKIEDNALQNLFSEPDKAMLMGLVMLLKSEGADEMLIMALLYIMS